MAGGSKPEKWPRVVRSGAASVKVFRRARIVDGRGVEEFTIYYRLEGREHRLYRTEEKAALSLARKKSQEIERGEVETLTLSGTELASYVDARKLLAAEGLTLEAAARDYVEAYKLIKPLALIQVARTYRDQHMRPTKPLRVSQIVPEFLKTKERRSARHTQTLKNDLARFSSKFGELEIGSLQTAEIESWLDSIDGSHRTRRNILGSVQNLFNFARRRENLPRKLPTEVEFVDRGKYDDTTIHRPQVFDPSQINRLLLACPLRLIPLVVLSGFCGVRREEVLRLDWRDVFGTDDGRVAGHVTVWADMAKTRKRRIPLLLPNAAAWLKPFKKLTGPVCPTADRFIQLTALAKKIGLAWPSNVLRDSFISHRVAATQNVAQVALEAGNSPQVIQESYLELVSKAQGMKYFHVSPPRGWPKNFGVEKTAA